MCYLITLPTAKIQCVPLATEPGISLIILRPMKILQRNLNRSTSVVWETKRSEKSQCDTWRTPSCREDWHLVWDVPAAHNWSHLLRCNHHNSCIYGNLQHLCKSNGWWGTLNWIFPAGWSNIPHFTASLAEIQSFFGGRIISKGFGHRARPHLTQPDYFLWGYLKRKIYQNKPQTIDALKANITEEIQAVTTDVLARTFQNMARRVQSCLDANGGHFHHILWHHISYTMR